MVGYCVVMVINCWLSLVLCDNCSKLLFSRELYDDCIKVLL